ncbi:MAG: hypothetical protein CVU56_23170 [Deltaproteobacteria bacterium HGW-Deltaproteobacteria-14]|jgi:tripeptide aminopeptidase|nr:MAG: hypothetical protein CVU56_23170 [Deltaproteobacteria bacterium HGW-Deltaproteobacteria-14]
MSKSHLSQLDLAHLGELALSHLEKVVAIDSQSDESSAAIPSTPGQRVLAAAVAEFFAALGATIERDDFANVIASFPGRGAGADAPALALMVHLDTARGTHAVPKLNVARGWEGGPIRYPDNPGLEVGVATYPAVAEFVGQDVVYGPGDAPFGLDDKLGLAHLMTLARVLADNPRIPHPPLLLIGRPDEEVGRMEAVVGLARMLGERGVRSGYTVDGILPFEVNVENFNAGHASLHFPDRRLELAPDATAVEIRIGGVNTHGATAHAEGSRSATRLAAELLAILGADATAIRFASDAVRDCDAELLLAVDGPDALARVEAACAAVIGPHRPRGASWRTEAAPAFTAPFESSAAMDALAFVAAFLASDPGFPLAAEDSYERLGYSAPYRIRPDAESGGVVLDVRLRDFDPDKLEARKRHVAALVEGMPGVGINIVDQYVNMGPRLADRPELVDWAVAAAAQVGVTPRRFPIRGGTGVDPFLDEGVAVANLGTGYFAPESEKELTSVQMMARHAQWLTALVAHVAETSRPTA